MAPAGKELFPPEVVEHWRSRMATPTLGGLMAPIRSIEACEGFLPPGEDLIPPEWMTLEEAKAKVQCLGHCHGFCHRGGPEVRGRVEVSFKSAWHEAARAEERWTSWRVLRGGAAGPSGAAAFWHQLPERPLLYGTWFGKRRAPVAFIAASSRELTDYIRGDPQGPFGEARALKPGWQDWGFTEDKEQVWKAEWHAVPASDESVELLIPRLGKRGRCRRAPPRVEAFAEAFRAANREVWSILHDTLAWEMSRRDWQPAMLSNVQELAKAILDQTHFGVVEAQVRWGREELRLPSHVDGCTSMLHLGLTLGGDRTLRLGVFPEEESLGNMEAVVSAGGGRAQLCSKAWEEDVWNKAAWRREHLLDLPMRRGSCYLSSPYCCEHAVEYAACEEREAAVALQFRFAFKGDYGLSVNWARNEDMRAVTRVVAGVLKAAGDGGLLRLPSMEELRAAEERVCKAAAVRERLRLKRMARSAAAK